MEATMQQLIAALAGTAMTTAGTISQEGIETMIAEAAAMSAYPVTLTSMSIIMTKEVNETTV
eukprot:2835379-Ditylum_brightwellii.AAC.1